MGLLPEYPGTSANKRAILDGKDPGITVFGVREELDSGPIYVRAVYDQPLTPNTEALARWGSDRSVALIFDVISGLIEGTIQSQEQPLRKKRPFKGKDWTAEMQRRFLVALEKRNLRLENR